MIRLNKRKREKKNEREIDSKKGACDREILNAFAVGGGGFKRENEG